MQPAREQSIRQKIGSIFNLGSPRSNPPPQKGHEDHVNQEQNPFITEDVLRVCVYRSVVEYHGLCLQELDCSVSVGQRMRAMKELHDIVTAKRLEEVIVTITMCSACTKCPPPPPFPLLLLSFC